MPCPELFGRFGRSYGALFPMKATMINTTSEPPAWTRIRVRSISQHLGLNQNDARWVTRWIEKPYGQQLALHEPHDSRSTMDSVSREVADETDVARSSAVRLSGRLINHANSEDLIALFTGIAPVCEKTLSSYRSGARGLLEWLKRRKLKPRDLTIELLFQYRSLKDERRFSGYHLLGANAFFRFLAQNECLTQLGHSTPSKADLLLNEYKRHLEVERGLARSSIIKLCNSASHSIPGLFGHDLQRLPRFTGRDVHEYVLSRMKTPSGKYITSNLTSLLRYLFISGKIENDLRAFLPKITRPDPVPFVLAEEERERVLAASRGKSAQEVRNFAILVLLNDLGLRACEVSSLEKRNVDWEALTIKVTRKGGTLGCLPLTIRAAKALAAYVRMSAADNQTPFVFCRLRMGGGPLSSSAGISMMVTRKLRQCGLKQRRRAAHLFRHGFATDMLTRGASLEKIGSLLGHARPDSTRIYTRVNIPMLRKISMPWIGTKHPLL
jgi:integrase/recombinase XerD